MSMMIGAGERLGLAGLQARSQDFQGEGVIFHDFQGNFLADF